MGLLIDGVWHDKGYDTEEHEGRFERWDSAFRHWVTEDGAPGPTGEGGFQAEPDRYHLYVSYACPWAHRALIFRKLKGLENLIGVSVVHWLMREHGWTFDRRDDSRVGDTLYGSDYLHEIYTRAIPECTGRVTVPVLWDKQRETIVSNESSEIIRMFNSAFDKVGARQGDYLPASRLEEIDAINERVYETLNNGVYKAGFATTQAAYEEAVYPLFETLDWLDARLAGQRFLSGDEPTEADLRLWPTLLRFDLVYHGHFKCNIRKLSEYAHLWPYARDLYQWPGIRETVDFEHAARHYHQSHRDINPHGILPAGPALDWDEPHGRAG